jgi:hypothetical protein
MLDLFTMDRYFSQGKVLNGLKNIVWTERYNTYSDFKIVSDDVQKITKELPLGTYLSHSKTREVMVVEDIEISKNSGEAPTISVTGRSIEAVLLESRISLPNMREGQFSSAGEDLVTNQYVLNNISSWHQAAQLIIDHLIDPEFLFWSNNAIDNIACYTTISGIEQDRLSRVVEPGVLYEKVLEILKVSNSGLKTMRPESGFGKLDLVIHQGEDISDSVSFSSVLGDLDSISYFWSSRSYKNAAFSRGTKASSYYIPLENTPFEPVGVDLKWVYADAGSITDDGNPQQYQEQVSARAREALAANPRTTITQAKVAKDTSFVYNRDYFIGDIVGIFGDYDTETKMRVNEFSWSIDQDKIEGYPSLSPVETA